VKSLRRIGRTAAIAGAAILAMLLLYAIAGLIGGAIPTNRGWTAPTEGVEVWVETNGIHTGIVVPKVAQGVDWRPLLPPGDLADPRYGAYPYASIGWGERTFYLETPTWADVRITTVLEASLGSRRTLMHVEHLPRPREGPDVRRLVLRHDEYRRLAAAIRASFADRPAPVRGYTGYDVFYAARGRYSAIRTCNAWTGDVLRASGVRTGWWTPFPWSVMHPF
jgi:uncharacterized protein (TIGR02117 family)